MKNVSEILNCQQHEADMNKIYKMIVGINRVPWLKRFCETKFGKRVLDKTIERKILKYSKGWVNNKL